MTSRSATVRAGAWLGAPVFMRLARVVPDLSARGARLRAAGKAGSPGEGL